MKGRLLELMLDRKRHKTQSAASPCVDTDQSALTPSTGADDEQCVGDFYEVVDFYDCRLVNGEWEVDVKWLEGDRAWTSMSNLMHLSEDYFSRFTKWVMEGCLTRSDRISMGVKEPRAKHGACARDASSTRDCLAATYENACFLVSAVRPDARTMSDRRTKLNAAPSRGPGCNSLADVDSWMKADRIVGFGRKVAIAHQTAAYQPLPDGAVYFVQVMTDAKTKHAFLVDTRTSHAHVMLDGGASFQYCSETTKWIQQWCKILRVHPHAVMRQ
jgi:hypothetical protein